MIIDKMKRHRDGAIRQFLDIEALVNEEDEVDKEDDEEDNDGAFARVPPTTVAYSCIY